jgi:thiosulfate reductase cytochrome b subunit
MTKNAIVQPVWLRATHWINALAVFVMVTSGLKIYNATAFLKFTFPGGVTLGGWLGGALQWHFAAMWLLIINGMIYLIFNSVTNRLTTKFFPLSFKSFFSDINATLKGRLTHADPWKYNTVQRFAYLLVMLDSMLLVLSGLVLWKSVQFPLLRALLGGYEGARLAHFAAMSAIVLFVIVHLVMVLLVPKTLLAMIRGR